MDKFYNEVGEKLNRLLNKTYNTEIVFKKAVEIIDHGMLKSYLYNKAKERNNFGNELYNEIITRNNDVMEGIQASTKTHGAWIDIESIMCLEAEEMILDEIIKAEKAALRDYSKMIVSSNLPKPTRSLLEFQKNTIENGLSRIKDFED